MRSRLLHTIRTDTRKRRARKKPKTTWRRTVEKERNEAGWKSWEAAKAVAGNRECSSENVTALCAYCADES